MRLDARDLLAVFAGGCVGVLARAGLTEAVVHDPGRWPWATLVANVVAAAILGWVSTRIPAGSIRRPLLGTGLCGGLSTFSTVQVELVQMLDAGHTGLAAAYAAASVVLGLAAVLIGSGLARPEIVDP